MTRLGSQGHSTKKNLTPWVAPLKSAQQQTMHYEKLEEITKIEKSYRIVSNPTETQNLNLVVITADLRWYTIKDTHLATGIRPKHVLVLTLDRRRQDPLCLPKENEDIRVYTYTLTPTHIHTFAHTNVDVCLERRGYTSAPRKNLTNQYL
jgi:hypothetical protein